MSDGGKKRTVNFDTVKTQEAADEMRDKYAGLLEANGLTDRFGISVQPEFHRLKTHTFYTYDLVLTDRYPDQPIPAFMQNDKFRLTTAHAPTPEIAPALVEEEEEIIRRPRGALYTVQGESYTLRQWADIADITYQTLISRLDSGMPLAEALTKPVQKKTRRTG